MVSSSYGHSIGYDERNSFDGARTHCMQTWLNTDTGIIRNHTRDIARYEKMRSYVPKEGLFAMVELGCACSIVDKCK